MFEMQVRLHDSLNGLYPIHSHKHQTIKSFQERLRPLEIRFPHFLVAIHGPYALFDCRGRGIRLIQGAFESHYQIQEAGRFAAVLGVLDTHVADSLFTSDSFTPQSLRVR